MVNRKGGELSEEEEWNAQPGMSSNISSGKGVHRLI